MGALFKSLVGHFVDDLADYRRRETTAVNLFIGLLMLVFDPLAIWLSMAASHAAVVARIELDMPRAALIAEAVPELGPAPIAEAVEVAKAEEPAPPAEIALAVQANAGA